MKKWILWLMLFLMAFSAAALECRCCGKELKNNIVVDDDSNPYCSQECMDQCMPSCVVCEQPCRTKEWSYPQAAFCSKECQEKNPLPKCSLCGEYSRNFGRFKTSHGDLFYCPKCLKLPRCFVCKLPCHGTLTGNGLTYCERCKDTDAVKEVVAKYGKYENTQDAIKNCERCGTKCSMMEVLVDNHVFCSYECARDAAPRCPYCKNPCIEMMDRNGFNKFQGYCSQSCLELAQRPQCARCGKVYDAQNVFGGGLCSWCARMDRSGNNRNHSRSSRSRSSDLEDLMDMLGDFYGF